jgi:DNA-binding winged helix-turn-helix (wHTH) protein
LSATQQLLHFGVFELNLTTEELRKSGVILKLPPQPFRLLAWLASHAGQVVARDTIQKQLWGEDSEVDSEHGIRQCSNQIRTALGDDSESPVYVETVPR